MTTLASLARQFVLLLFAALGAPWLLMSGLLLLGYPDLREPTGKGLPLTRGEAFDVIETTRKETVALAPAVCVLFVILAALAYGLRSAGVGRDTIRGLVGFVAVVAASALIIVEALGFYMPLTWPTILLLIAGVFSVAVFDIADVHDPRAGASDRH